MYKLAFMILNLQCDLWSIDWPYGTVSHLVS